MSRTRITRWLMQPLVTSHWALVCGIAAVAVPTLIRFAVSGVVTGCEFTPYLPFVLLSAVLLRWWQAGAVALGSAAVFSGVFVSSPAGILHDTCLLSSVGMFLGASTMIIAIVVAVRLSTARMFSHADETSGGIVFSMENGHVWASWYGQGPPVCLGSQQKVGEMMEDFLAQEELAKRLAGQAPEPGDKPA